MTYELALGVALTEIISGAIQVGEQMVRTPDAGVHDACSRVRVSLLSPAVESKSKMLTFSILEGDRLHVLADLLLGLSDLEGELVAGSPGARDVEVASAILALDAGADLLLTEEARL
jgi:hypothetical protein